MKDTPRNNSKHIRASVLLSPQWLQRMMTTTTTTTTTATTTATAATTAATTTATATWRRSSAIRLPLYSGIFLVVVVMNLNLFERQCHAWSPNCIVRKKVNSISRSSSSSSSCSKILKGSDPRSMLQAVVNDNDDGKVEKKSVKSKTNKRKQKKTTKAKKKQKKKKNSQTKKSSTVAAVAESSAVSTKGTAGRGRKGEVTKTKSKSKGTGGSDSDSDGDGGSDGDSGSGSGTTTTKTKTPDAIDMDVLGDLTGGRPGAIIETEEQVIRKEEILREIESRDPKDLPAWFFDYGELEQDEEAEYDIDDPNAIDAATLGTWTIQDLKSKFDYEWDPSDGSPDPNIVELSQPNAHFVKETEKDDEGVEVGYDPIFGPSNPIDTRTKIGTVDSYMIDDQTKDETMLAPQFPPNDIEIQYNEDIVQFRKSLDIIETYVDPFLPKEMPIPRHVAKWHGYPEQTSFPSKDYNNNRFTDPMEKTDFDSMDPYRARTKAVELARAKNAEWLPPQVSQAYHEKQRAVYDHHGTLVGSLRRGHCDPQIVDAIQPALQILGSVADLLSIEQIDDDHTHDDDDDNDNDNNKNNGQSLVFRFAYYGLMKNRYGMACWTETLIRDCGINVTGVHFETGFRKRDQAYDGGDVWHGPSFGASSF